MTDIWDEKPEAENLTLGLDFGIESEDWYYDKEKMDAWLEKLKKCYDIYVKQFRNMTEHAVEQQKKLEAIKEWYKHEADKKGDNPWWYSKRLRKLSKILETEG